jgi:hypothetical protein
MFPPNRIVCLTEETVETLHLLREQDRIVGISGDVVRPSRAPREKPRVSSRDALAAAAGAGGVVSGDLSTIAGARTVADEVNKLGRFYAVIHNAGVGYRERRVEMEPGVRACKHEQE